MVLRLTFEGMLLGWCFLSQNMMVCCILLNMPLIYTNKQTQSPTFKALLYNLIFLTVGSGLCSEKNTESNCFPHRIRQVFLRCIQEFVMS